MERHGTVKMARISPLTRGMVIDVNLNPARGSETRKIRPCVVVTNNTYNARVPVIQVVPLTAWSERKAQIMTNVEIPPSSRNGCAKKSVADCLQTRPVDHQARMVRIRGELEHDHMARIDAALKIVFDLQ